MNDGPLVYMYPVGKRKPYGYDYASQQSNTQNPCPFCNPQTSTDIYETDGDRIWLRNKYPTLKDTMQTILVESSGHQGDISAYTREENRELMEFGSKCFQKMHNSGNYQSVLWYKNFRSRSDDLLQHPHIQVVGLDKMDGYKDIQENNFTGFEVGKSEDVEMNLFKRPVQGYQEVDTVTWRNQDLDTWADLIQESTQYVRSVLSHGVDSYDLFFYPIKNGEGICCKVIPRFYAPPCSVGYKLSQVDDDETLEWEAARLKGFITNGISPTQVIFLFSIARL